MGLGIMQFTDADNIVRTMGNRRPMINVLTKAWPVYGDRPDEELFDPSDWLDRVATIPEGPDDPFLDYVHDQDGMAQANACAVVAAVESQRRVQNQVMVALSPADLYERTNGDGDYGSLLEETILEAMTRGIGTAQTCGALWRRNMTIASDIERARYRITDIALCPTFRHMFSAALKGRRLLTGLNWHSTFRPDADGWLAEDSDGVVGGHALFGYKAAVRKLGSNYEYGIWHQGSWGTEYAKGGRFVVPSWAYHNVFNVGGWWALRGVSS